MHDVPLYREFARMDNWTVRLPNESTILRFRHLPEKHKLAAQIFALVNDILRDKGLMLRAGTVVNATLLSAPSSTKNASSERDPEMHQRKKGNRWYFGMKAHIAAVFWRKASRLTRSSIRSSESRPASGLRSSTRSG
ncbi:hypothetical protein WJ90_06990 [Burkholderia ubonensis]|nr:hypothetical protein WJ90_06990 [Burkholderia ubonensis]KVR57420.1 hypothetical protein WK16_04430 [Burkholderia ubonensis]